MTDPGLQLDMFKRVRKPRVVRMSFLDAGWNARGEAVAWFECPQCEHRSGMIRCEPEDRHDGPPCPKCNKDRKP